MFTFKIVSSYIDHDKVGHTTTRVVQAESFTHDLKSNDFSQRIVLPNQGDIVIPRMELNGSKNPILLDGQVFRVYVENSAGKTTEIYKAAKFDKLAPCVTA